MNSFRDKLLLSLSLTLILIVAIVTTVIGFAIKSQATKITRREMQVQNRLVAVAIDQVFQNLETDVRIVSRADVLTGLDRVDMESYSDNVIAENPNLATLAVLTPKGYSVASSGRWREDSLPRILNQSRTEFFQASNGKRGEVFVAGPVYCGDQPTIIMLCPIIDAHDANSERSPEPAHFVASALWANI